MTKQEAIAFYGTQKALALALNCTREAVAMWKEVPWSRQCELELLSKGKLKADPDVMQGRLAIASALLAGRKANDAATKAKAKAIEMAKG